MSCFGRDKLFKNSLVIGRIGRHVFHESSEGIDELVRRDSAWWRDLGAAPGCRWPNGVSVVRDTMDVRGGVCQYEGIRRGFGVSDDILERLLRVLEVGLPLFLSLIEPW